MADGKGGDGAAGTGGVVEEDVDGMRDDKFLGGFGGFDGAVGGTGGAEAVGNGGAGAAGEGGAGVGGGGGAGEAGGGAVLCWCFSLF